MAIENQQMDKFTWKPGDVVFDKKTSIPINLKPVIEGISKDGVKGFSHLQRAVKSGRISLDEFRFILRVTQEPKPYKYE